MSVASAEPQQTLVDGAFGPLAVVDHGGAGPSVLLVHGGGSNAATWHAVAARLVGSCHVRAVDLPGHGLSRPLRRWSWEEVLADLDEVIAHMPGPVTLVGHSLGGMLALLRAARVPRLAAALSLDGWMGPPLVWPWADEAAGETTAALASLAALPAAQHLAAWRTAALEGGLPWTRLRRTARRAVVTGSPRPSPDEVRAVYGGPVPLDLNPAVDAAGCPVHVALATQADDVPWWDAEQNRAWHASRGALAVHLEDRLGPHRVHLLDGPHDLPHAAPAAVAAVVLRAVGATGS